MCDFGRGACNGPEHSVLCASSFMSCEKLREVKCSMMHQKCLGWGLTGMSSDRTCETERVAICKCEITITVWVSLRHLRQYLKAKTIN